MVSEASKPPSKQLLNGSIRTEEGLTKKPRQRISWKNVFIVGYVHAAALYALIQLHPHRYTVLYNVALHAWALISVTMGGHRLWAHKSYKAKWPLRLFLAIGQTVAYQFSIYKWVWLHRVHHKFTDTDADPHNSKRGFFFSHIGWIMQRHHEEVFNKRNTIDLSDLENDWMIKWQDKLYPSIGVVFCFIIPTLVPYYFWSEDFLTAWHFSVLRFMVTLHATTIVNSIAHTWGSRPYDSRITSTDNVFVSLFAFGEGSHNYHHVFPWDYKTSESKSYLFNLSLLVLDLFGKLGLAHDFKEASQEMIQKRRLRTGITDWSESSEPQVWGLEDEDMDEQEKKMVKCT